MATSSCPALRTRRLRLCRLASIALPALAGALAAPASADERFAPDTVAAATPLRPATVQSPLPRPAAVTAYAPGRGDIVARASAASGSSRDAAAAASTRLASKPWLSARLVEVPRDGNVLSPTYRRPRYALGFRSDTLKDLATRAGFDAQSCLAPIVRLRTKLHSDGDVSGTFWIYARCSLR